MGPRQLAGDVLRRLAPRTLQSLETLPGLVRDLQDDVADLRRRGDALAAELSAVRGEVATVREQLDETRSVLEDARVRGGVADDAIAQVLSRVEGLESGVAELDSGLTESRRLSLRVAQMTDLVFDRLGGARSGDG